MIAKVITQIRMGHSVKKKKYIVSFKNKIKFESIIRISSSKLN